MQSIKIIEPIHIIGLGCAGMRVLRSLDELGPERIASPIHLWDGDVVKIHNVRAQLYRETDVGQHKVYAALGASSNWSKLQHHYHRDFVREPEELSGTVFVCVDSMEERLNIWKHSIKGRDNVSLMIEMRLGTTTSTIHVVDPTEDQHQKMWEHYWYPDEEASVAGSCGTATSRGPISSATAEIAVWQLVRYCEICGGAEDRLDNQIQIRMCPPSIEAHAW